MAGVSFDSTAFWAMQLAPRAGEAPGADGAGAFWSLREAPLHLFGPADWARYYPAMAPWLHDADLRVRDGAVERLMMAAFSAEPDYRDDADTQAQGRCRAAWLVEAVERAGRGHPDVLAAFLRRLRWHGDDEPSHAVLLPWLRGLAPRLGTNAPGEFIEGAILMLEQAGRDEVAPLFAALDHRSAYVRACAAYAIGWARMDDPEAFDTAFIEDLTARELLRPGLVGPFWSGWSLMDYHTLPFDPLDWMLGIIERRSGPEPADMDFNGIDFHVHELADHSPEGVRRLLAVGRIGLALMAATEVRHAVAAMAPVLRELAAHSDPVVAAEASHHLARYYAEVSPEADPDRVRHVADWRAGIDAFVLRHGEGDTALDITVLVPRGEAFDDAGAWAAIDAALPPALRGAPARHPLASYGAAPGPVRVGNAELHAYASGARVHCEGDPIARRWRRLEIVGSGLQGRWHPFAW